MDDHTDPTTLLPARIEPRALDRAELTPAGQLAAAIDRGLSPETIAGLMACQERWEATEARKAYHGAMAALKQRLPAVIAKDAKGERSTYASLAKLCEVATPLLSEHGFSASSPVHQDGDMMTVTTRIVHAQGHAEEVSLVCSVKSVEITSREGKKVLAGPQAVGATYTYLRRYTLVGALGLATADMDDADQAPAPRRSDKLAERRLAALATFKALGVDRAELEHMTTLPVEQWTGETLDWLRGELARRKQEQAPGPREPGAEG